MLYFNVLLNVSTCEPIGVCRQVLPHSFINSLLGTTKQALQWLIPCKSFLTALCTASKRVSKLHLLDYFL